MGVLRLLVKVFCTHSTHAPGDELSYFPQYATGTPFKGKMQFMIFIVCDAELKILVEDESDEMAYAVVGKKAFESWFPMLLSLLLEKPTVHSNTVSSAIAVTRMLCLLQDSALS